MSSIHLELLDKKRKTTLEKLRVFRKEATLAGGTALFLQIAHRYSFDFDLFLERELVRRDFLKLKKIVGIEEVRVNTSEQLTVITDERIDITLAYYPYKPLFTKIPTLSLPLFSVKDIAADKAFTIGKRAVWRDYVDLFFILKRNYLNVFDLIKLGQKKFGVEFNPELFLEQAVYFDDLEISKISFIKEKYSPKEIQEFLKKEVSQHVKDHLGIA